MCKKRCGAEDVDAGVDFRNVLLVWGQGFLFDDGFDFRRIDRMAHDAAVAGGIVGNGGQNSHGCLLRPMKLPKGFDGFRANERHIAGENENVFVACYGFASALHGVARAALLRLVDKANACSSDGGFHAVSLVADDSVGVLRGGDVASCSDDVREQRLASDLVKNLWAAGFETGSLARRHDDDGEG